jgi:hypothetical protein
LQNSPVTAIFLLNNAANLATVGLSENRPPQEEGFCFLLKLLIRGVSPTTKKNGRRCCPSGFIGEYRVIKGHVNTFFFVIWQYIVAGGNCYRWFLFYFKIFFIN